MAIVTQISWLYELLVVCMAKKLLLWFVSVAGNTLLNTKVGAQEKHLTITASEFKDGAATTPKNSDMHQAFAMNNTAPQDSAATTPTNTNTQQALAMNNTPVVHEPETKEVDVRQDIFHHAKNTLVLYNDSPVEEDGFGQVWLQQAATVDPIFIAALADALEFAVVSSGKSREATCFDSKKCPKISIRDYLLRIAKYLGCSQECLVMAMVYLNRAVALNPNFSIDSLNIHKLLLGSIVLAIKFLDDDLHFNNYFADIGGINLSELNQLELSLLTKIQWRLHVLPDEYNFSHNLVLLEVEGQRSNRI